MPLSSSISLKVIAKELGISNTAVSMALRNRKGVSEKLRQQVLECAARLGYAPDPITVELMTIVRSKRPVNADSQLIAYINTFKNPALYLKVPNYRQFDRGAIMRAKEYGYQVEVFNAFGDGMNAARLGQILKARGVRGVLIGPRYMDEPDLDIDWSAFSAVLVGSEKYGAGIYRVCNNHVHTSATTLHHLDQLGYKRIGVVFLERYEATRGFDYVLGVEQFRKERGKGPKVEVSFYREWDHPRFVKWVKEKNLDAVVSLEPYVWKSVQEYRKQTGQPLGYACLSVTSEVPTFTGINQHYEEIGATAMESLRSLMMSGARGAVPRPQIILIEGEWTAGETAPPVSAAMPASK
jgi:LacI family transcriptional regulator